MTIFIFIIHEIKSEDLIKANLFLCSSSSLVSFLGIGLLHLVSSVTCKVTQPLRFYKFNLCTAKFITFPTLHLPSSYTEMILRRSYTSLYITINYRRFTTLISSLHKREFFIFQTHIDLVYRREEVYRKLTHLKFSSI